MKHNIEVRLDRRETERLLEYEKSKDMSVSAVLRQAFRVYDMMERTPGAYEAVRKLQGLHTKPTEKPHAT